MKFGDDGFSDLEMQSSDLDTESYSGDDEEDDTSFTTGNYMDEFMNAIVSTTHHRSIKIFP